MDRICLRPQVSILVYRASLSPNVQKTYYLFDNSFSPLPLGSFVIFATRSSSFQRKSLPRSHYNRGSLFPRFYIIFGTHLVKTKRLIQILVHGRSGSDPSNSQTFPTGHGKVWFAILIRDLRGIPFITLSVGRANERGSRYS